MVATATTMRSASTSRRWRTCGSLASCRRATVVGDRLRPRRFNGPPDSANGGYTCGWSRDLGGAAVRSPCGRRRRSSAARGRARGRAGQLRDGETVVADGRPADSDPGARPSPWTTGRRARPRGLIAGAAATLPDLRRLRARPRRATATASSRAGSATGPVRATWTPDPWLGDDGLVRPECVWGGLDCPTSAPVANFGQGPPVVLARLTSGPCTPSARVRCPADEIDGRKRTPAWPSSTGTASARIGSRSVDSTRR